MRILFVTTEAYPLVKTGGLADVAGALSAALAEAGEDVCLLLPAYTQSAEALVHRRLAAADVGEVLGWRVRLIEGYMPDSGVTVLLAACPLLFERPGNPYSCSNGRDWPDNHERFAVLSRVAASVAVGEWGYTREARRWPRGRQVWRADVVHANDWQTGLVPAYLKLWKDTRANKRPASVFTIHNLAFQGLFPPYVMGRIGLPLDMFSVNGVEFYGDVSYLKAGLYYSDRITTVSPTYAHEIQTDQAGQGLQGLLLARANDLVGILNGEDERVWNPAADPRICHPFTSQQMLGKALDKMDLQRELGLQISVDTPLFAVISRLTEQKGVDLVLGAVSDIMVRAGQLVILGAGDHRFEVACLAAAESYPGRVAVRIGLDEALAHRIQAGSDVLLMPSRFEPCGLSQMYAMRYGTLPVVRRTGGLADTVVDVDDPDERGTGFVFDAATVPAFLAVVHRAFDLYRNRAAWQTIQSRAMGQDFSWRRSAERYRQLYRELVQK
ncbi:Glycogen synthase, ADP-glucose transglucosylase [invertebrate metagenome]|uniref:starch synthase n=1 Tax=invertebrate metagenome TaxID=1711999 RepID=A0A484H5N3_9ZZZZ